MADDEPGAEPVHTAALVLSLGRAEFAVPIDAVREVLHTPPLARTPFTPPSVCGVVAIRGSIVAVVDLGLRLLQRPARRPGRLLVVVPPGGAEPIGLLVDDASGLVDDAATRVRQPPVEAEASLPPGWIAALLEPEPGRLVTLLDLAAVLRGRREAADVPEPNRPVTPQVSG